MTLYDAAIPLYLRMLRNLAAFLDKAEAHAAGKGADVQELVDGRLIADMHSLVGQVQLASDAAKGGAARLAGMTPPSFPDEEKTMADLKARVARTIAFVETVTPEQVNGDEDRIIELKLPTRTLQFTARDFVFNFSLPNFLFHVVTAYGVLRSQGVPLGKLDYLAGGMPTPQPATA